MPERQKESPGLNHDFEICEVEDAIRSLRSDVEIINIQKDLALVQQVTDKIESGDFDFLDLQNIDLNTRYLIAFELINSGQPAYFIENIEDFAFPDSSEIVRSLFELGYGEIVNENIGLFEDLSPEDIFKLFNLNEGEEPSNDGSGVPEDLSSTLVIHSDREKYDLFISEKFETEDDLDFKKFAELLIKIWKESKIHDQYIDDLNDQMVAKALQYDGQGFDHCLIANELLESDNGISCLAGNITAFKGLDKDIAFGLIDSHEYPCVVQNLECFEGLVGRDCAFQIIEYGDADFVVNNLERFNKEDHRQIIERIAEKDAGVAIEHSASYKHLVDMDEVIQNGFARYIQVRFDASEKEAVKHTKDVFAVMRGAEDDFGKFFQARFRVLRIPNLWNDLIYPTIMSQKTSAFLCLEDIREIINTSSLLWLVNFEENANFLKYITTQFGVKSHDILKNLILKGLKEGKIESIFKESELIRDFLSEEPLLLADIYEAYKIARLQNNSKLYRSIVETTKSIQERVALGKCTREDFKNRFFPAIMMYTFPPSVGVEREEYKKLIRSRKDKQTDVPKELEDLQGRVMAVNEGGYKLKDGEKLNIGTWSVLLAIVRENKDSRLDKADMIALGRSLMNDLYDKNLRKKQNEHLKALYNVYCSRGQFLPDSIDSHKKLMTYKEYVGDHLNDIIGLCVKAWQEECPQERIELNASCRRVSDKQCRLMIKNALFGKEYSKMHKEMQKFEFIEGAGRQDYELFISKKREHGCVGLNMGVCVAPDNQLWNRANFMNVLIMCDNIVYGGMHFLILEERGKKYLTLPGINPNEAMLSKIAADDLYDEMIKYAKECAEKLGCEKVLIPVESNIHSNRPAIQQVISSKAYEIFKFKREKSFSYNPFKYKLKEFFVVE